MLSKKQENKAVNFEMEWQKKTSSNQTDLFAHDTRSYRYLVILNPGFHITEKVKFFREKLNNIYAVSEKDLYSKPHLTLCYYDSDYECDELISQRVRKAVKNINPFDLIASGVDYWKSGTFYIKIENPIPVIEIVNNLKRQLAGAKTSLHPHITIIKKLKQQHYMSMDTNDFDFEISAPCYSVTILKQLLSESSHPFEVLQKVDFNRI